MVFTSKTDPWIKWIKIQKKILDCINSLCVRVNSIYSTAVIKVIQNCTSPDLKTNKNVFEFFKLVLTKPWLSEKLNSGVILWNKIQFSEPYWIILSTLKAKHCLQISSFSKVCHGRVKEREMNFFQMFIVLSAVINFLPLKRLKTNL